MFVVKYKNMVIKIENHNLGPELVDKINCNKWKFFKFKDNPGIEDSSNKEFYKQLLLKMKILP